MADDAGAETQGNTESADGQSQTPETSATADGGADQGGTILANADGGDTGSTDGGSILANAEAGEEQAGGEAETKTEAASEPLTREALTIPEGFEVEGEGLEKLIEVANGEGGAKALLDTIIAMEHEQAQNFEKQQADQLAEFKKEWEAQANHSELASYAKRGLLATADEEFAKEVMASPLGSNPKFLRMMANVGKKFSEAQIAAGDSPPVQEKRAADVVYPNG